MTTFDTTLEQMGVHPTWAQVLRPATATVNRIAGELATSGEAFLPAGPNVLRVFSRPMDAARVLVIGQDPYPTPGHAVGLSFSVARDVRPIPKSLQNIYRELNDDLSVPPAAHGDLSSWFDQGVLLMNRCLTVAPGQPASHRGRGWEELTSMAVEALAAAHRAGQPLTAILWGRDARESSGLLRAAGVPVVESSHPSPLSATYGFFGSRPFSRTNAALAQQGAAPIDWSIR